MSRTLLQNPSPAQSVKRKDSHLDATRAQKRKDALSDSADGGGNLDGCSVGKQDLESFHGSSSELSTRLLSIGFQRFGWKFRNPATGQLLTYLGSNRWETPFGQRLSEEINL